MNNSKFPNYISTKNRAYSLIKVAISVNLM